MWDSNGWIRWINLLLFCPVSPFCIFYIQFCLSEVFCIYLLYCKMSAKLCNHCGPNKAHLTWHSCGSTAVTFTWTSEPKTSFGPNNPIAFFNPSLHSVVPTDASDYGLGAVTCKKQNKNIVLLRRKPLLVWWPCSSEKGIRWGGIVEYERLYSSMCPLPLLWQNYFYSLCPSTTSAIPWWRVEKNGN